MFDNAKSGVQHNIPFQTNFKMFKHLSVSVGGQYTETWTGKTIRYNDFNEGVGAVKDTISVLIDLEFIIIMQVLQQKYMEL